MNDPTKSKRKEVYTCSISISISITAQHKSGEAGGAGSMEREAGRKGGTYPEPIKVEDGIVGDDEGYEHPR